MGENKFVPIEALAIRFSTSRIGNKPIVGFVELTPENDAAVKAGSALQMDCMWLARKSFGLAPGNVYAIQTSEDRKTFAPRPRWLRQYGDAKIAASLQASAKAWDLERAADAMARREGAPTAVLERVLTPIRHVYAGMTEPQRIAFEVWLIRLLRRGK